MWPSNVIWRHRSGSTLAQVLVWCQTNTWTNVDFSTMRFCGIHLRAISQWVPKLPICIISSKIILWKSEKLKVTSTSPRHHISQAEHIHYECFCGWYFVDAENVWRIMFITFCHGFISMLQNLCGVTCKKCTFIGEIRNQVKHLD